jgi:hypothetical protein
MWTTLRVDAKKEEHFTRPDEEELDVFYRKATHTISEFCNDSRTSKAQLKYARDSIAAVLDKIRAEKALAFPKQSETEPGNSVGKLKMVGYYGDLTPQKARKRARF